MVVLYIYISLEEIKIYKLFIKQLNMYPYIVCRDQCIVCRDQCIVFRDPCIVCRDSCIVCRYPCIICRDSCIVCRGTCIVCRHPCIICRDSCIVCRNPCFFLDIHVLFVKIDVLLVEIQFWITIMKLILMAVVESIVISYLVVEVTLYIIPIHRLYLHLWSNYHHNPIYKYHSISLICSCLMCVSC